MSIFVGLTFQTVQETWYNQSFGKLIRLLREEVEWVRVVESYEKAIVVLIDSTNHILFREMLTLHERIAWR